ncbi:CDC73 protein [Capsaspora owczarzaki ATCC 30864]|uniref:CDC73 protein n=1 Tax=Capsaspora owczarzaki (strain ATCC 30864) TaxID=595528 RepID=A0A0D2WVK8_CAPO3|nr:CDC73 protein [Capsaspora owczarzaki ATCC 30864]KJE96263.1 CDC73 protein [Capsaspora owczarzaki ATCC 30864]|eukprot:XP_004344233.1 CDC73 protein [Capsaspora owczarzaki ATCC 30864]
MADPLTLLRDFTQSGRAVQSVDSRLVFGNLASERSTQTNFKRTGGGYYTLDAIWFLLQNADKATAQFGQYIRDAQAANVPSVALMDRKDVLSYIRGEIATTPKLDLNAFIAPAEPYVGAAATRKHAMDEPGSQDSNKRTRMDSDMDTGSAASAAADQLPLDVDSDEAFVKELLRREKLLRTRSSVLQASKNFSSVLNVMQDIKKRQEQLAKTASSATGPKQYNRYETQEKDYLADSFQLDASGTNLASPSSRAAASPATNAPEAQQRDLVPIIIVPAVEDALITLANVKELLENSHFVSRQELRDRQQIRPTSDSVLVLRKKADGKAVPYRVIDSTLKLRPEDWKRVVAVFAHGPAWQFKGWKWPSPAELFMKVKGFHLMLQEGKVEDTIKSWDVSKLVVNPRKPHLDTTAVRQFWEELDNWTSKRDLSYLRL